MLYEKLMRIKFHDVQLDMVNFGIIDATYRENGKKCRLTLARETVGYPLFVATLFAKDSPYPDTYNKQ